MSTPTPNEVRRQTVPFAQSAEEAHATASAPRQLVRGMHTLRLYLPTELSARLPSSVRQHTASFPLQSADSLHSSSPEYLNCVACPHFEASLHVGGTPGALQHMRREALLMGHADEAPQGTLPGVAATWKRSASGFAATALDIAGSFFPSPFAPLPQAISSDAAAPATTTAQTRATRLPNVFPRITAE